MSWVFYAALLMQSVFNLKNYRLFNVSSGSIRRITIVEGFEGMKELETKCLKKELLFGVELSRLFENINAAYNATNYMF